MAGPGRGCCRLPRCRPGLVRGAGLPGKGRRRGSGGGVRTRVCKRVGGLRMCACNGVGSGVHARARGAGVLTCVCAEMEGVRAHVCKG